MAQRSRYVLGLLGVAVVAGLLVAGVVATRGGSAANADDLPTRTVRPSLVFQEPTPAATAATSFGAGSYVVGRDIELGRYSGGLDREVIANCFWQQTDTEGAELDNDGKDRPNQVLTLLTEGTRLVVAGENCTFDRLPD
ncbi:hypothetical protein LWF15_32480 [Kineosporia rhizophila]|uniref:hypothetical protein n=1 Tax=Kineosporia rhizophila TaxID=84633 RepID=UPI001E3C0DEB|nr:hypothetical protein [Kineosporia rhizophila]MCE0540221.1 hypothetical protein [Kineosporia rhizophila]